jgi:two-component system sensor histidine kinase/response regulator
MCVSLIDITARKEAEERDRRSADLLHSVIESFPDTIFVKDLSLRMLLCNSAHARSIGKRPEETYGNTDIENDWGAVLVKGNPEKGIEGREKDELAVLSGKTVQVSGVPLNVENEIRFFDIVKMPLRDRDGAILGIIGIGHDVTERSRAEAALDWEHSFFNTLMENLPDHIYFKDKTSRFLRISTSLAHALGLRDPSEAIGKTNVDFFGKDQALKALEDEQQIVWTGIPLVEIEERETYPDRPDTWVLTSKMPLEDQAGDIIGTFGISHDITHRKRLEEKNRQLATLVEFADDGIVGLDMARRIVVWNRGAERIYGYTAEEMMGAPISTLIPPELADEGRLIQEKLARDEPTSHFETIQLRKDGARITVSLTLSAIRDAAGSMVGLASISRDVTAEKAIQAQLNRAQRLASLAILAGGVAHQFNNINTVVKGYLDLLKNQRKLPARLMAYVEAASTAVQKAVEITDRLLALTEPAGAGSKVVRFDLLARTVAAMHEKRIGEEQIRLVLDIAEAPPVPGDESRLKFVLSSLIGNALDSLLDRPVRMVCIRTGGTKDGAFFEVEDSGCGIPKEDLPRIFSPFFSGKGEWAPPGSPQGRLKGVGLSLAISNTTVSEYGGRIDVQSTTGAGSTFKVVIPAATEHA